MVVTVLSATARHPIGGIMVTYELANGLARRGHEVHLVHINAGGGVFRSADEITWCELDPRLRHSFPPELSAEYLPDAEFLSHFGGQYSQRCGLPFHFVQGYRTLIRQIEDWVLGGPYPKLCPSQWLVDVCRGLGVPERQAIYLPLGLRHDKYRLLVPIEERPMRIAMAYNSHPLKGAENGLRALVEVKQRVPEAEIVVFGAQDPEHDIPPALTYVKSPPQEIIVDEIYNGSRLFLSSSRREGFGFPSLEAMACGCALVTTDSRGSREYAIDDQTAVVSASGEPQFLADHLEALLHEEERRLRLARGGLAFVKRFDWNVTARRLESFMREYRADPAAYQVCTEDWSTSMSADSEDLLLREADAPSSQSPEV